MKLLVLSDSHAALSFMRLCVESVKPDVVIHLGDQYDDANAMEEEYPHIRFYCVPGNCDHYRVPADVPQTLVEKIAGVTMYMTHGHLHHVKSGEGALIAAARSRGAQVALYGHTHVADCHREEDGLWVLNPGSCGHGGGSAGVIETDGKQITACYLVKQADLEEMV